MLKICFQTTNLGSSPIHLLAPSPLARRGVTTGRRGGVDAFCRDEPIGDKPDRGDISRAL